MRSPVITLVAVRSPLTSTQSAPAGGRSNADPAKPPSAARWQCAHTKSPDLLLRYEGQNGSPGRPTPSFGIRSGMLGVTHASAWVGQVAQVAASDNSHAGPHPATRRCRIATLDYRRHPGGGMGSRGGVIPVRSDTMGNHWPRPPSERYGRDGSSISALSRRFVGELASLQQRPRRTCNLPR